MTLMGAVPLLLGSSSTRLHPGSEWLAPSDEVMSASPSLVVGVEMESLRGGGRLAVPNTSSPLTLRRLPVNEWIKYGISRLRDGAFLAIGFLLAQLGSEVYRLIPMDIWSQIPNTLLLKLLGLLLLSNVVMAWFVWIRVRYKQKLGIYWRGTEPVCAGCRTPMNGPYETQFEVWVCTCPKCKTDQVLRGTYRSLEEIEIRLTD